MVADTYSARLGMLEMGTGNQNNSWGTSFNGSVTDIIDRAIAGVVTRSNTGGALDLSGSPPPAAARADLDAVQIFNGTLTSDLTVTVPNLSKIWDVCNFTSGAFNLFFKTASGTAVQIPQGARRKLILDGANNIYREDRDEVGKFVTCAYTAAGPGELACNGASLLRASYPDLFAKIGTTWGTVDGTHFTLPNLQDTGRYLRSSTGALTVGTYQSNLVGAHNHTVTGAPSVGTLGTDNPGNHTHANFLSDLGHNHGYTSTQANQSATGSGNPMLGQLGSTTGGNNQTPMSITNAAAGAHTHTITGAPGLGTLATASNVGAETRPESAVALICIKY